MRNYKTLICLFLALSIPFFLLVGCTGAANGSLKSLLSPESTVPTEPIGSAESSESSESSEQTDLTDNSEIIYSEGIDENGFWIGLKALDYIENYEFQALPIPNEIHNISDERLQSEIMTMLASFSTTRHVTDREIVNHDTVNIDFVGSIDGIEFEGGSTEGVGMDVIIGETEFIDDFLNQLIGHMPGEIIDVEVTFPDNYFNEEVRGKDALFITTVNYIVEQELEAELNDEFVMENLYGNYGWMTVEEMNNGILAELQMQALVEYVMDYFTSGVGVRSVPDLLMDYQERIMLNYYQDYADYLGIDMLELIYSEGLSDVGELINAYHDYNLGNATYYLVAQAVAERAGISVNAADMEEYYFKYYGSEDYSVAIEQYGLPFVTHVVLCQKAVDYVIQNAILL